MIDTQTLRILLPQFYELELYGVRSGFDTHWFRKYLEELEEEGALMKFSRVHEEEWDDRKILIMETICN